MFSSGPGIAHPLVLLFPFWIQTQAPHGAPSTSSLTSFSLLAVSAEIKLLLSTAITNLRMEPYRLVGSCIHSWGRTKVLATPKPQGLRVEWDDSQECNYQDKGAWGLVKIEVISYVLETTAVHSMRGSAVYLWAYLLL